MAVQTETSVSVKSRNNRELPATPGKITRIDFDKPERTKNALRTLGMFLTATFIAVFIPIVHWFLVPILLISSFVVALDKLGEVSRSLGGKGECAKCHQPFSIQGAKWNDKYVENCDHCHEELEVTPQAAL